MKLLAAALAVVLSCAVAHAAQAPDTLVVTGPTNQQIPLANTLLNLNGTQTTLGAALGNLFPFSGGTITGKTIYTGGMPSQGGSTYGLIINGGGGFNQIETIDPSTLSGPTYWHYNLTTLSPAVNTGNVWQNDQSYITLNGPGSTTGELNLYHAHFQIGSGATSAGAIEGLESSINVVGASNIWAGALVVPAVMSDGTVTGGLYGIKAQLNNANTTSGSVAQFAVVDLEAMAGSGSVPTGYFVIRNAEPNASLSTLGGVQIGSLAQSPQPGLLGIKGPDTSSSTCPLNITDSASATIMLACDDGSTSYRNFMKVGINGAWGRIVFGNTTSGTIQLNAPGSGALGSVVLTLPDVTGTVAADIAATSSSIGGSALAAGACASTTVAATNATTAMAVSASPVTYPGDGAYWLAYVSAAGTVTVKVCATVAMTPGASAYNVRVVM